MRNSKDLKQDDKKVWFKAKNYGWGWYPSTWQGFLVIAIFMFIEVFLFLRIDASSNSTSDTLVTFLPLTLVLLTILLVICYIKGEKPGWKWGK